MAAVPQDGAAGAAGAADDDGVAQLKEITDYFKFSVYPDATYRGTVLFRLSTEGKDRYDVSVRICDDGTVAVWEGKPPDGKVSVTLDMPKADFLRVYSGTASATAVSKMVLSGRLYVHGFAYRGLKRFADSFDYSSECWKRFYAARDEEAAKRKAEEDAAAAAAQAQADAQAADRVGGTKVTAPGADARAEGILRERAEGARLLADALGDVARADLQRELDSVWTPGKPGLVPNADAWRNAAAAAVATGATVAAKRRAREARRRPRMSVFKSTTKTNDRSEQAGESGSPKLGPALSVYLADPSAVQHESVELQRQQRGARSPAVSDGRTRLPADVPPLQLVSAVCTSMLDTIGAAVAEQHLFMDVLARECDVRYLYGGFIAIVLRRGREPVPAAMPHITVATLPGSGPVESRLRFVVRAPDYWRRLLDSSASAAERTSSSPPHPGVASPAPSSPLAVPATTARDVWLPNPWWLDPMSTSLSPVLPIPFLPGPATHPATAAAVAPTRANAPTFSLLPCCDALGRVPSAGARSATLASVQWHTWAPPSAPSAAVAAAVTSISDSLRGLVQPAASVGTDAAGGATAMPAGNPDELLPSGAQGHGIFPISASWLPAPRVALGDTQALAAAASLARAAASESSRGRSGRARWRKLRNYVAEVRQTATEKAPPHRSHFGNVMVDPGDVDHEWGRGLNRFMPAQPGPGERRDNRRSWALESPRRSQRGADVDGSEPARAARGGYGSVGRGVARDLQDEAEALGVPPVGEEFG